MTTPIETVLGEMLIRYPRQEIPAATLKAYAADLADIPLGELRMVCRDLWLSEDWWPSIATIRRRWLALRGPLPFDAAAYQARRLRPAGPTVQARMPLERVEAVR